MRTASSIPRKRLLIRMDDAGLNLETNRGIQAIARAGVGRTIGIMACAPEFNDAVARLRQLPNLAIGVHLTLNSEWTNLRWGPVLPVDEVPSLVDEEGYLPSSHQFYRQRLPDIAETMAEIQAQIAAVIATGLKPCYADEHMAFVSSFPELAGPIRSLLRAEGLVYARDLGLSPINNTPNHGSRATSWIKNILDAPAGDYLLVTHPAAAGPGIHSLLRPGREVGEVGLSRNAEYEALLDPSFGRALAEAGVTPISYDEFLPDSA